MVRAARGGPALTAGSVVGSFGCVQRTGRALGSAGAPRLARAERRVLDELERRAEDEGPPADAEAAPPAADAEEPYESKVDANGGVAMEPSLIHISEHTRPD